MTGEPSPTYSGRRAVGRHVDGPGEKVAPLVDEHGSALAGGVPGQQHDGAVRARAADRSAGAAAAEEGAVDPGDGVEAGQGAVLGQPRATGRRGSRTSYQPGDVPAQIARP